MSKVPAEVKKYMAGLAKKSWEKRKDTQDMSEAGKKGAEKRWGKKNKTTGKPLAKKTGNMPFTID